MELPDPLPARDRVRETGKVLLRLWVPGERGAGPPPVVSGAESLVRLGPAWTRLGALLRARPDLAPWCVRQAVSRPAPAPEAAGLEEIREILRTELGTRLAGELRCVEAEPLHLGALTQDHGAILADGRAVVLRVVRPGVEDAVRETLDLLPEVRAWIEANGEPEVAAPLAIALRELEVDLPRELDLARAAEVFREITEDVALEGLKVPRVVGTLSTPRLLTRERISGGTPRTLPPRRRLCFDPGPPVRALLALLLERAVVRGRVYGDPGPDHLRVTPDGRLGLTEVRRVGTLAPGLREPALRLLVALARRDTAGVTAGLEGLGTAGPGWDPTLLREEIGRELRGEPEGSPRGPGALLEEVSSIAGASGLGLPPGLVRLGGTLRRAEDTGRLLDAGFDPGAELLRIAATVSLGAGTPMGHRPSDLAAAVGGRIQRRGRTLARRWLERHAPAGLDEEGLLPAELERCATDLVRRIGSAVAGEGVPGALLGEDVARLIEAHRRAGTDVQELVGAHVHLSRILRGEAAAAAEGHGAGAGAAEAVRVLDLLEDACAQVTLTLTRAVREWQRRYEEENRRIFDGFTQIVRHELANRLGASESAVRLLLSDQPVSDERRGQLLQLCLEGIRGGLHAVDDIGLTARPVDLDPPGGTIGLQLMVMEAMRAAEAEAESRGIRLALTGPVPDVRVPGGPLRVALANLLGNALKYHHEPGRRERWVRVSAGAARGVAEITVEDNGPGVPAHLRHKVFEYRYRGVAEPEGSGLGLAITRVAVERADGRIRLEDGSEGGARFVVRLPAEEPSGPEA